MKKLIISTFILLSSIYSKATTPSSVHSDIKNVTVFLNGAQVNREAAVKINKGLNYIVFDSLSPSINTNSIQISGKGNFIILDTKYMVDQPNYNSSTPKIPLSISNQLQLIKDSIDQVNFDIEELAFKKEVLNTEKQLLTGNGSMKSDSLALLKDALAFFRAKYNDINSALINVKKEEYKAQKRLTKLNEHLNKLNTDIAKKYTNQPLKPNHKVMVTLQSEITTSGKLALNYMVANASWSPGYDLRTNNVNESVALTYKANVYQNSGEDWENVQLKLSTNNPHKSKAKPVLPVWYLNYYNPNNYPKRGTAYGGIAQPTAAVKELDDVFLDEELQKATSSAMYSSMTESFTNIEFTISIPYSIESDGQNHVVAIKEEQLDANYQYYLVPKMDANAFLVASIKGFEDLNLLPATANIYFSGTYIGQTMINTQITGDSLAIDLGREERITAQRKLLKKEEKDQLLGNDKVKTYRYEMSIKNNMTNAIDLIVEDQIPVSNDKEIKIEPINKGKATMKENTGALTWTFNLTGKNSKKIEFAYQVQYNKDKSIAMN